MKVDDFIDGAIDGAAQAARDGRREDDPDHEMEAAILAELARLLWGYLGFVDRNAVATAWDPMGERETVTAGEIPSTLPDGWRRLPDVKIPVCDVCPRVAAYRHPSGQLRCGVCPRPDDQSAERASAVARRGRKA